MASRECCDGCGKPMTRAAAFDSETLEAFYCETARCPGRRWVHYLPKQAVSVDG